MLARAVVPLALVAAIFSSSAAGANDAGAQPASDEADGAEAAIGADGAVAETFPEWMPTAALFLSGRFTGEFGLGVRAGARQRQALLGDSAAVTTAYVLDYEVADVSGRPRHLFAPTFRAELLGGGHGFAAGIHLLLGVPLTVSSANGFGVGIRGGAGLQFASRRDVPVVLEASFERFSVAGRDRLGLRVSGGIGF